jgi:hypothetical protein
MRLLLAAGVLTALVGCGSPMQLSAGGERGLPPTATTDSSATTRSPRPGAQSASFVAAVAALRDDAQRLFGDTFAGVYWQSGRVKLTFIRDAEALRDRLMRNFPRPELVDAVTVKFSSGQLQAVANRISADVGDLARQGVKLSTWGVNPPTNRVEVGIEQPTPAIIESLQERYGAEFLDIIDRPRGQTVAAG